MNKRVLAVTIGLAIAAGTAPAWANIGMENIAAGVIAEGHGGTAIAVGDDTSVMNTNPALLANIENNRMDANMTMMFPEYSYKSAIEDSSGMKPIFVIPTMGLAWKQTERMHLGIAFFNEGGSGTDYGPIHVVDNSGNGAKVLTEYYSMFGYMVVTPSLAYKATDNLSLGISAQPGYAMARMKMPFDMEKAADGDGMGHVWAADMNMHDYNYRTKIGALYTINPAMGVGFSYTTKTDINLRGKASMISRSLGYMQGDASAEMGWPSSFKIGGYMDMRGMGMQRMSLDIERINWSEYYKSVPFRMSNITMNDSTSPITNMSMAMNLGWTDQTAYKLGFEQPFGDMVTMRMGWVHGRSPVPDGGILAIMNPIVEDHYTMGMGIYPNKNFEINMAMTYGVGHKQTNNTSSTVTAVDPLSETPGTTFDASRDMNGTTVGMKFYTMSMGIGYKW
jgi:long-subunit fatty acid transport protein